MLLNDFYTLNEIQKNDTDNYDAYISLNKAHAIFQGHFPDNPITPGVCMLQIFKNIASEITQKKLALVSSKNIKFLAIINPEVTPDLRLNLQITTNTEHVLHVNCTAFMGENVALKISAQYKTQSSHSN